MPSSASSWHRPRLRQPPEGDRLHHRAHRGQGDPATLVLMLQNETKNQHYISQAEQRLNALNQSATKERQRIYAF
jgi:hypothetical protein